MSEPLVTCLIATRGRLEGLFAAIESIRNTATDRGRVHFVLKIDGDDEQTLRGFPFGGFDHLKTVKAVISPRGKGYQDLGRYITEASALATTPWSFLFDDDSVIEGKGWDDQLAKLPTTGYFAQCEWCNYRGNVELLGQHNPVGIIFPTRVWEQFGHTSFEGDAKLVGLMRSKGWHISLLTGITLCHNRGPDDQMDRYHQHPDNMIE